MWKSFAAGAAGASLPYAIRALPHIAHAVSPVANTIGSFQPGLGALLKVAGLAGGGAYLYDKWRAKHKAKALAGFKTAWDRGNPHLADPQLYYSASLGDRNRYALDQATAISQTGVSKTK